MADPNDPPAMTDEQQARALLELLDRLRRELQPGRRMRSQIDLDSSLDRDLGFDSLARAEMLLRIEQQFGIALSEQLLMSAETPRELLEGMLRMRNGAAEAGPDGPLTLQLEATEALPERAETLQQVLRWHLERHPRRPHLYLYRNATEFDTLCYDDLGRDAQRVAALLLSEGAEAGQSIAIMLPTSRDYFATFFGILLIGAVPVPIYPPARPSQLEEHLRRHGSILDNAQARIMVTVAEAKGVSRFLQSRVRTLQRLISLDDLQQVEPVRLKSHARGDDTALLQYTSGSTGNPKGVVLSHANLLANIRAFGRALEVDSTDVCVSWLPLYHDMGLIGAWLGSLYHATPLAVCSPLLFLSRPQSWLQMVHRHRGTLSAAPNFAYELCLRKLRDAELDGLDLSCWRAALNGAEAVSPDTLRRFSQRLRPCGFRPQTLLPVYGLAECSVALAFPPIEREPRIDRLQREILMRDGEARPAADKEAGALEFASVGRPLPGHQIRIVDSQGREVPERREGQVEFMGPSATAGYFRNPQATAELFHGAWLDSGDRGYMAAGELYITGRTKDIIIRAGRNLYPHELEEAVSQIDGIHKGGVAVFSSSREPGHEQLVVVAETGERERTAREHLKEAIHRCCLDLLGTVADDIHLAPRHAVPKTSSGKVRRAACRQLYLEGRLGRRGTALWWQLARLGLASLGPRCRQGWHWLAEYLYGGYLWGLLLAVGLPVWLLMALLPHTLSCRRLARGGVRLVAWLSRTRIRVQGMEHLPLANVVLVANHCSYLDALLLTGVLPPTFSFVAKAELKHNWLLHLLLRRLGTEFVERFDLQRGLADARQLSRKVAAGKALIFFPEGTFDRIPGVRPFHMGAFAAAAEAGIPMVPITLSGTRSKLRDGAWLPRRGDLGVTIAPPLQPEGRDWSAALSLRDRARAVILEHSQEPDRSNE